VRAHKHDAKTGDAMDQHSTASSLHMCDCPFLPPTSANYILFLCQPQSLDPTKKKKIKNFMYHNNSGTKYQTRSSGGWPLPKSDDLHQILYRIKSAAQHGASYIVSRFFSAILHVRVLWIEEKTAKESDDK
jgi:hypothetical protein